MHHDEMWQVYAPNGEAIPGEGWDSALGNPKYGESKAIIGGVVVFLYRINFDGELEFLWQARSMEVDRDSGYYDTSTSGHVNLGETPVEASIRELKEEIGAKIETSELKFVTSVSVDQNTMAWMYLVDWTGRPDKFIFDDGEVSKVKWIRYDEMENFRKTFAKEPLRRADLSFLQLDVWLRAWRLLN